MANRPVEIMAALRSPGSGCAWDLEQTFETIAPFTIEESYEIADAVARGDMNNLKEQLGDLLLQVVFPPGQRQVRTAIREWFVIVVNLCWALAVRAIQKGSSP
jgi:hypothetical protein